MIIFKRGRSWVGRLLVPLLWEGGLKVVWMCCDWSVADGVSSECGRHDAEMACVVLQTLVHAMVLGGSFSPTAGDVSALQAGSFVAFKVYDTPDPSLLTVERIVHTPH